MSGPIVCPRLVVWTSSDAPAAARAVGRWLLPDGEFSPVLFAGADEVDLRWRAAMFWIAEVGREQARLRKLETLAAARLERHKKGSRHV